MGIEIEIEKGCVVGDPASDPASSEDAFQATPDQCAEAQRRTVEIGKRAVQSQESDNTIALRAMIAQGKARDDAKKARAAAEAEFQRYVAKIAGMDEAKVRLRSESIRAELLRSSALTGGLYAGASAVNRSTLSVHAEAGVLAGTSATIPPLRDIQNAHGAHSAAALGNTGMGKYHTLNGHGFAFEDINHINDVLSGNEARVVGGSNAKDGADRIVNGINVQSKCYATAQESFNSCFDPNTGLFRYGEMHIEVPAEQRDEFVKLMEQAIKDGRVPGASDPAQASSRVRRTNVTRKQAINVAKSGTVEGLVYDVKTNAVNSTFAGSLSFGISYACRVWSGESQREALTGAVIDGVASGAICLSVGVGTAQIVRTRLGRSMIATSRTGVRLVCKSPLGRKAVVALGRAVLNDSGAKAAKAITAVTKLSRSNAVTAALTLAATSLPDLYRATVAGTVSWSQAGKNLVVNGSGVAAGTAGAWAGAAFGAAIGNVPGMLVFDTLGALGAGQVSSSVTRKLMGYLVKDDSQKLLKAMPEYLRPLAMDYCLFDREYAALIAIINKRLDVRFLRELHGSKDRAAFVYEAFYPVCENILSLRQRVSIPSQGEVEALVAEIVDGIDVRLVPGWNARTPHLSLSRSRRAARRTWPARRA